jgi:endonuclease YncB( thermonuclease family)
LALPVLPPLIAAAAPPQSPANLKLHLQQLWLLRNEAPERAVLPKRLRRSARKTFACVKTPMMIDAPPAILCHAPRAVDGDTIACANLPANVRLLGIDAPELPGHCHKPRQCTAGDGQASARALAALLKSGPVWVAGSSHDRYGRILARVRIGTIDASCRMISAGHAVPRYSRIGCPGGSSSAAIGGG